MGEELERKAHAKEVDAAADLEQAQRVQQQRMRDLGEELERKAHIKEADAATEVERSQRVQQEAMVGNVLPQLERKASARNVDQAAEAERQERVTRDKMAAVEEELRRKANALEAERQVGLARVELAEERKHELNKAASSSGSTSTMEALTAELTAK